MALFQLQMLKYMRNSNESYPLSMDFGGGAGGLFEGTVLSKCSYAELKKTVKIACNLIGM
jgi:hypothetical protein